MKFTAEQIAGFLNGTVDGDPGTTVENVSKIEEGCSGTLAFLANPKYEKYIYETEASIVLINQDLKLDRPVKATLIRVKDAYQAFASLLVMYEQAKPRKTGIHEQSSISPSAGIGTEPYIGEFVVIGENARIGNSVSLHPQVYIGDNVQIGDHTTLHPGVKVMHDCIIGSGCTIHPGTIIGSDGFGFALQQENQSRMKVPQVGNVVIGDNVEIGAQVAIDRATMGSTRIGNGVKMDNLIQIAHNVEIGDDSVVVAQAGVAGSTKIGKNVILAAQAGLVGHLQIGDGAIIAAQAGVTHNIKEKEVVLGSPAFDIREYKRSAAVFRRLPDLRLQVLKLEKDLEAMKKSK